MNKHIELVKKWLADPDSVTLEELKQNRAAAYRAAAAVSYAAHTADNACRADAAAYRTAASWVEKYEALENDDE